MPDFDFFLREITHFNFLQNNTNLVSTTIAWFLVEKKHKIRNSFITPPKKIAKKIIPHPNPKFGYQIPPFISTVLECTNYF
jgi:hypothetical protein